jgi:hypothetical protein
LDSKEGSPAFAQPAVAAIASAIDSGATTLPPAATLRTRKRDEKVMYGHFTVAPSVKRPKSLESDRATKRVVGTHHRKIGEVSLTDGVAVVRTSGDGRSSRALTFRAYCISTRRVAMCARHILGDVLAAIRIGYGVLAALRRALD